MKKMVFGIALTLFGFSIAYISVQAQWAVMQRVAGGRVRGPGIFDLGIYREREIKRRFAAKEPPARWNTGQEVLCLMSEIFSPR